MTPVVQIVADSVNAFNGKRLTTFYVEYERFFHQEVLTHGALCRNSASSRAIPTATLAARIADDPVLPTFVGVNCKGMAAAEQLAGDELQEFYDDVTSLAGSALWFANKWGGRVHKQNVNRYLEPFMPIGVVVSGTEWGNFFHLRYCPDAEPHFARLAGMMHDALWNNTPALLMGENDVHAPYLTADDWEYFGRCGWTMKECLFVSATRCARASFFRAGDGSDKTLEEERDRGQELCARGHWSPLEHQARAADVPCDYVSGRLRGFEQFRSMFTGENVEEVFAPSHYKERWNGR